VIVEPDCSVPGHPEIKVIGDMACFDQAGVGPLPGVAPVAIQQGRYVADAIVARLEGRACPAFRYRDKGRLAVIGRAAAVADFGRLRFSGYPAWLIWLFVHIMLLVGFENRVLARRSADHRTTDEELSSQDEMSWFRSATERSSAK
jgi:NADH dehydrogenase